MTRYPLFSRNCQESQSLTGNVLILGKHARNSSNMLPWILNSARRMQVQCSLFHLMTLSGGLRHFQTLSNSQWCNLDRIDRSSRYLRVQWLLPVLYNMYRRKHLNAVFRERKSSSTSCTYNTTRVWVCWLLGGKLTRETITWKNYLRPRLQAKWLRH